MHVLLIQFQAQPMGRFEELELERAVHLQIIADLKGRLRKVMKISIPHFT